MDKSLTAEETEENLSTYYIVSNFSKRSSSRILTQQLEKQNKEIEDSKQNLTELKKSKTIIESDIKQLDKSISGLQKDVSSIFTFIFLVFIT